MSKEQQPPQEKKDPWYKRHAKALGLVALALVSFWAGGQVAQMRM